jgi:hypothetical protein
VKHYFWILSIQILFSSSIYGQDLTTEQKMEDVQYMYDIFENNYPYFGVLQREHGIDWLSTKEKYCDLVSKSKDNVEFITAIKLALDEFHSGHTDYIPTFYRDFFIDAYAEEKDDPKAGLTRLRWRQELEKGDSYWADLFGVSGSLGGKTLEYDSALLELRILDEGNIAVLKIESFSQVQVSNDSLRIRNYLESIRDYAHLIIDIQDNSGGDARYWQNNIVPLLINEEVSISNYLAVRKGKFIRTYVKEIGFKKEKWKVTKSLPNLPEEVNSKDFYLTSSGGAIEPLDPVSFKGKIYLMVNNKVYSSAEGFAGFCKATKWATIVGETTGGDGVGADPALMCLPNSKVIIRFPSSMGLNPDGSSNEEMNTTPDIEMEGRSSEERLYKFAQGINPEISYTYKKLPPILNYCNATVLIYPTKEETDSLNSLIKAQVYKVNEKIYGLPDSLILPDTVALKMDLSNQNIVCIGSVNGNLWATENLKKIPVEISQDYIRGRKKHIGQNLSLITSWFNEASDQHFVCFYTAQKSSGILDIHYVFHGPSTFVIANSKHEALESGNYRFDQKRKKFMIK